MKMKTIKSFEHACEIEGLDPEKVIPDFSCYPERHRNAMAAQAKIILMIDAVNRLDNGGEPWFPDYTTTNASEDKWEPWFVKGSSGFRLHVFDSWHSRTSVGSRLCFKEEDTGEGFVNQHIDLYNEML